MRILIHDFAGLSFSAQLARELAKRQHRVAYVSCGSFSAPKGRVTSAKVDPENFSAINIMMPNAIDKDNLIKRYAQQQSYVREALGRISAFAPDLIFSSGPIEFQESIIAYGRSTGAAVVFWVQDIHADAIERLLIKKNRLLGLLSGVVYRRKEANALVRSDSVVVITSDFRDVFRSRRWNIDLTRCHTIENWSPLEDFTPCVRNNAWATANMRAGRQRIVYSGTLARKHNPGLLLHLARHVDADVYLFSEGSGPRYIREMAAREGLENLIVRPWVPAELLPTSLGSADIVMAIVEADAGVFSVPSKTQSYFCAGRPILASMPAENLASINITKNEAGLVSKPGDLDALVANANRLLADGALRARLGANGRAYAEKTFDIRRIATRFEAVFDEALNAAGARRALKGTAESMCRKSGYDSRAKTYSNTKG